MNISGNIITLNEEANIEDCIKSLRQVCDEIIVVDSGSSDKTVEIATSLGAKVIHQPYLGDGIQKNVALAYVSNEWVLSIDADERLTQELVKVIKDLDFEKVDAFSFRRRNMIGSRWIKYCGWYPDRCTRLYNHKKVRFENVKQHASVKTSSKIDLDVDLIHYSFKSVGELFSKPGRNYTNRGAKILYKSGKRAGKISPFTHGLAAFIKSYIFKKGFLGGIDGFSVSLAAGVNSYLKYAKLIEFQTDPKSKDEDFDNVW